MQYPKVLVGCPTSKHKAYCLDKYAQSVKALTYPNYDILLVDNSKTDKYYKRIKDKELPVVRLKKHYELVRHRLAKSRNILRKKVLDEDYDYLFSLEQDVIPPRDIIERLLEHSKKIICGVYYGYFKEKYPPGIKPLLWRTATEEEFEHILTTKNPLFLKIQKQLKEKKIKSPKRIMARFTCEELEKPRLVEIFQTGLGCILIHKSVLEEIKFRSSLKRECFDDVLFCEDVRKSGYKMYVDTALKCKHLIMGGDWGKIKW